MRALRLLIAACILAAPATLHAQAAGNALVRLPKPAEQHIGRYKEFIVDDTGSGIAAGLFDFPIDPSVYSVVIFPEDITFGEGMPKSFFQVSIEKHTVAIFTHRQSLPEDMRRNVMLGSDSMSVGLMVTRARTPEEAVVLAVVRRRSEVERQQAELAKLVTDMRTRTDQDVDQRADEKALERFLAQGTRVRPALIQGDVAQQVLPAHAPAAHPVAHPGVAPVTRARAAPAAVPTLASIEISGAMSGETSGAAPASAVVLSEIEGMWWGDEDMLLSFVITNTGETAFDWSKAQVFDPEGRQDHAGATHIQHPAISVEGLVGRLPVGQHARGAVLVKGAKAIEGPMTLMLTKMGGGRPVMATVGNWLPLQLEPSPTGWEIRPAQPPDLEKDKVSVHLQGVYGAIWLGDSTGADLSDATSITGLGVRAQYAFNRYLAFEGELMGASTGTARFDDVTYDGVQGDLVRSASLGRMQIGGVVRMGKGTYVPIARLGVGLQGASHSGTITTAAGEEPGPDPFEWTFLFAFGAGLDVRLGPIRAGIMLSGLSPFGKYELSHRAIEAGIHLGYAWTP